MRFLFSSHELEELREAAKLCRLAAAKEAASDEAFERYVSGYANRRRGTESRSQGSLAASARNRARAFEIAAGDADRAWYRVDRKLREAAADDMPPLDNAFTLRAEALTELADELEANAVNLSAVFA